MRVGEGRDEGGGDEKKRRRRSKETEKTRGKVSRSCKTKA